MKFNPIRRFIIGIDSAEKYLSEQMNQFADLFNQGIYKLSLENIDGQIISDIIILAGAELGIGHNLQSIPKYRIILRQSGNGLITDGPTPWTNKEIYLKNNGASDVILTIFLMR